jgi:hypothetical protein
MIMRLVHARMWIILIACGRVNLCMCLIYVFLLVSDQVTEKHGLLDSQMGKMQKILTPTQTVNEYAFHASLPFTTDLHYRTHCLTFSF